MKNLTLEAVAGVVVGLNEIGAMSETGNLPEFFARHVAGEIKIQNINRPDLAEVFKQWKARQP